MWLYGDWIFLVKSTNKKTFRAEDGSAFDSQSDLDVYETLYEKTKPLFSNYDEKGSAQQILGFEKSFISKLKTEGFSDLQTLVKYRVQLKSLSDLINS